MSLLLSLAITCFSRSEYRSWQRLCESCSPRKGSSKDRWEWPSYKPLCYGDITTFPHDLVWFLVIPCHSKFVFPAPKLSFHCCSWSLLLFFLTLHVTSQWKHSLCWKMCSHFLSFLCLRLSPQFVCSLLVIVQPCTITHVFCYATLYITFQFNTCIPCFNLIPAFPSACRGSWWKSWALDMKQGFASKGRRSDLLFWLKTIAKCFWVKFVFAFTVAVNNVWINGRVNFEMSLPVLGDWVRWWKTLVYMVSFLSWWKLVQKTIIAT